MDQAESGLETRSQTLGFFPSVTKLFLKQSETLCEFGNPEMLLLRRDWLEPPPDASAGQGQWWALVSDRFSGCSYMHLQRPCSTAACLMQPHRRTQPSRRPTV